MTKFKDNLLEILQERNIRVSDFLKSVGLGKNAIYNYENGSPSLLSAIKIADTLGVDLDYLAGTNDHEPYKPPQNTINFYNNLTSELSKQNISKLKFCKDLDFSTDVFTRWKNGALPYLSNVIKIAHYLNLEIEELIGRK